MLELTDVFIAIPLFLLAHFWWKTMQAREHAEKLARVACQREGVQLLDVTVSLKSMGIKRNKRRRFFLLRYFSFEFSCTGSDRRSGVIAMCGNRQHYVYMDLPEPVISVEDEEDSV
jgi:hypothetical protein